MKKLMTMIGAAVAAFGLYADTVGLVTAATSAEEGERYTEGESVFDSGDSTFWFMAEKADDAAVVKAYEGEGPAHTDLYKASEAPETDQLQYVGLDSDAPVFRTFAEVNTELETPAMKQVAIEDATAQRGGIIADQLVKLSAFDTDTVIKLEDGAKIAVWLKTIKEGDSEEDSTYALMATCGALEEETFLPEETTVQLEVTGKTLKPNEWHQLTITAIKALDFKTTAVAGFKVEVDGVVANVAAGEATLFPEGWDAVATAEAKTLIPNDQLLPSAVRHTDTDNSMLLQGIAFKGSGAVDDITVAQKGLYEIQIEIKAPAGAIIAGVDKGTYNEATGKWTVTPGDEITISLARDGYNIVAPLSVKKTITGDMTEIVLKDEGVTVTPAVAQIVTNEGATTNLFATLPEAIAAVAENDTIEVVADITDAVGMTITGKPTFTIDFGGHEYIVNKPGAGSTGTEKAAFQLIKGQTITFKNGTMKAAAANLEPAVVGQKNIHRFIQNYANLTLTDMTFDCANLWVDNTRPGDYYPSAIEVCFGEVTIDGATSINAKTDMVSLTVDTYKVASYATGADVEIDTTGTIASIFCYSEGSYASAEPSALTLTDGTISALGVDGNDEVVITKAEAVELDPPTGYQWNETTGVLEPIPPTPTFTVTFSTNTVTVAEKTLTDVESGTVLEAKQIPTFVEEGKWDVEPLGAIITCDTNFNFTVKAEENWDVPAGDEDKPAQEVWKTIPSNLADVPAGKLSTWAKKNEVPFGGEFTETMSDAYLLDCAPTAEKVADEKAKINIASIEFVNGKWVITTVSEDEAGDEFGNGKLELVDVTKDVTGAEGSDATKLWKMKLVPITAK